MFNVLDPKIANISDAAGVGYFGTCAELRCYTGFIKEMNLLPGGGYIGAARIGIRLGEPSGATMRACPSCTYVNINLGVGFIDNEGNIVIPPKKPEHD